MRLTSWNYLHGQVLNPSAGEGTLRSTLTLLDSAVIALQEIDAGQERSGGVNQSAEIAELVGAQSWGFAPTIIGTPGFKWRKLRHEEKVVEQKSESSEPRYGISIVSKVPVHHWLRKELGRSVIGMPLAVAGENGKLRLIYVRDEPRVALAAVLENGWTVINVHLSFVPLFNIYQLLKVSRWARKLEKEYSTRVILLGDFNLPWGIPAKVTKFNRATDSLSYPSWAPKVSFDYILAKGEDVEKLQEIKVPQIAISDHRPLSVEIAE